MHAELFVEYAKQFLAALSNVFPECEKLKKCISNFNLSVKHLPHGLCLQNKYYLVESWSTHMGCFKKACQEKNGNVVMRNENFPPSVRNVDFEGKWKDPFISKETRDSVWEYLIALNACAFMYTSC